MFNLPPPKKSVILYYKEKILISSLKLFSLLVFQTGFCINKILRPFFKDCVIFIGILNREEFYQYPSSDWCYTEPAEDTENCETHMLKCAQVHVQLADCSCITKCWMHNLYPPPNHKTTFSPPLEFLCSCFRAYGENFQSHLNDFGAQSC